ncbi:MFS transporter [Labedaea rhizosphaerae]|uniref:Putative MFS family arabinose efflux permease n=1 Tax=Labedaea rhizosphaerae TaxID=598644 RepID=A0A4V3CYS1_LABRH|nr:MFS transporter [Labedaea rhizosphaerae]TDP95208.1 putative MFS family arabinose efflux permease [Labedaea rhizosphaerae]
MTTQTTRRRPFSAGVWRNRNFVLLWTGQTFSQFGAYVSTVVIPLLAIQTLHAGATDLGVIGLMSKLPALLYIVAGVWVDRVRKRPLLVGATAVRAVLLLLIPLEVLFGVLTVGLLSATLFVSAVLTVWFDTAYMSYLPALVGREHLVEGNSRMESARATAQVTGPSIGGLLVQAVTAPVAVLLDGLALLGSAATLSRIKHEEAKPTPRPRGVRAIRDDLAEGLRFLARHPVLRPLAAAIAINNFAWAAELTLYVIYLVDTLHLPASLVGLTLIGSGPGALVGSLLAAATARRLGLAGAITGGLTLFFLATLLIPLAPPALDAALPMLIAAGFLMSVGGQVCAINVLSLRQGVTPDHLHGRVNGSFRFLSLGLAPLGALAGGLLGSWLGTRAALYLAVAAMALGPIAVQCSAARRMRTLPEADPEGAA